MEVVDDPAVDLTDVLLANLTDFTNDTIKGNKKEFLSIIRTATDFNATNLTTIYYPPAASRITGFNIGVGVGLCMAVCLILAAFRGIIVHRVVHSKAYRAVKRRLRDTLDPGRSRRRARKVLPTIEEGVLSAMTTPWTLGHSGPPPTRTQSQRVSTVPNGTVLFPPSDLPRSMTSPKRRKPYRRRSAVLPSIEVTPPSPHQQHNTAGNGGTNNQKQYGHNQPNRSPSIGHINPAFAMDDFDDDEDVFDDSDEAIPMPTISPNSMQRGVKAEIHAHSHNNPSVSTVQSIAYF